MNQPNPGPTAASAEIGRASDRSAVDPRGPRFATAITALLLLVDVGLALTTGSATDPSALAARPPIARLGEPAAVLLFALFALFVWGATAGVRRHPFGLLFARLVRPRLSPRTTWNRLRRPPSHRVSGYSSRVRGSPCI